MWVGATVSSLEMKTNENKEKNSSFLSRNFFVFTFGAMYMYTTSINEAVGKKMAA